MAKQMGIPIEDYMKTLEADLTDPIVVLDQRIKEETDPGKIAEIKALKKIYQDNPDLAASAAELIPAFIESDLSAKEFIAQESIQARIKKAPAKKKTKEPLAAEKADKLIDDIIGEPKVNAKTKRKLESIQKESKAKADDAISKAEEIDSITEEMNDKLDDDLCI